ncbi:MAG: class I SAM-dependent methyltransferase [Myxococcales bacterium]|jgi:methyltransferase (TIGR00027 family)
MRKGVPSGTSFLVSFARGLGVDEEPIDAVAPELLPAWLAWMVSAPGRMGGAAALYRRAFRVGTLGLVDHAVLRTLAIDSHLAAAIGEGVEQVVILGAGLDARAWRMAALERATVFEVDHPSTQRYKRKRVANKVPPTDLRYVAVDFETDRFSEALEHAGFRRALPSIWIWEGVTMYLPLGAIHDAISQIRGLASEGSSVALTYRAPDRLPWGVVGRAAIPMLFAAAGEPLKATLDAESLRSALGAGWEIVYDDDARGWKKLSGSVARPSQTYSSERLAVARRRR